MQKVLAFSENHPKKSIRQVDTLLLENLGENVHKFH